MPTTWIALYPQWYIEERRRLARHYPDFRVYESKLREGVLILYGELEVRPPGGTVKYPVLLEYPAGTPFEKPVVLPLKALPEVDRHGEFKEEPQPRYFDHRHQMPSGVLCLFQREPRAYPGGDVVDGVQALSRAERWFLGHHTGHWPPDSAESELESHFLLVTDILLGDAYFADDLGDSGRFYMVPDLRRRIASSSEVTCPMIATTLSTEGGIIRLIDARDDLSRIYPWIKAECWDLARIAELDSGGDGEVCRVLHGHWWSLPHEPRPFRDGAGLLETLAAVAERGDAWAILVASLKGELQTESRHFLGFRFPARHGGFAWLMVLAAVGERGDVRLLRPDAEKRRDFEGSKVFGIRVHAARPPELRLRNRGVVDDVVCGKTVALVGLGALGSEVAELLAKAGVGKFRLCDPDRLSTGNVARHVGGLNEFGAAKVRVVASRLLEINPRLKFEEEDLIFGSAVGSLDGLTGWMSPADLTVVTTADEGVESVINQVAVVNRKAVLYGRALRRGSMGRVFLVRPGRDACKACLAEFARTGATGGAPPGWMEVAEDPDDAVIHECGRPVIPASAIDLAFVASLISRIALDVLEGKDGEPNHWLWSRSPAPDIEPRLAGGLAAAAVRLEPRPGCHACQEPDVVCLRMSEQVRAEIVARTEASPDAETGGVLIGYVDEQRRAVALRATGPGPRAERSRTRFSRDPDSIQAELDRGAIELGARGLYVGEWHSHLEASPQPSPTDVESLFGIASAPNYLTRCPVMVIAGLDPKTRRVQEMGSWTFPLGGRVYRIENEVVADDPGGSG